LVKLHPDPKPGVEEKQVARLFERNEAEITRQRQVFDIKRREFMHAAYQTAGAQLPASKGV
jgi:hypothetical protein